MAYTCSIGGVLGALGLVASGRGWMDNVQNGARHRDTWHVVAFLVVPRGGAP